MEKTTHCFLLIIIGCLCVSIAEIGQAAVSTANPLDTYNVVWDTPSADSSESMPCGGGDIGLNVWVENGDVLFYMQRSGSLAENNAYLKLGRVRLQLDPNPFEQYPRLSFSGQDVHPAAQVIDDDINTKWFVYAQQAWVQLDFGPDGVRADNYTLTSAEDVPDRDPKDWTLSGSNDGQSWTVLDQRQDWSAPRKLYHLM